MKSSFNLQRGATLAVALILMLLLTILGITATQVMLMEEKMTSNMRDKQLAFQASESALSQAENILIASTTPPIPISSCTGFPCVNILNNALNFTELPIEWWGTSASSYNSATLESIKTSPKYYVEFVQFVPDSPTIGHGQTTGIHYFRITGRGTGGSDEATSLLQTTVAKRY